jgi:hypothetical protein
MIATGGYSESRSGSQRQGSGLVGTANIMFVLAWTAFVSESADHTTNSELEIVLLPGLTP